MENEKKEKVKKIFRGIWLGVTTFVTFIFTICVVIGCSQQNKQSNAYSEYDVVETYDNEYQLKYDNHRYQIEYIDSDYTINISGPELLNYNWVNLNSLIYDYASDYSTGFEIGGVEDGIDFSYSMSETVENEFVSLEYSIDEENYYVIYFHLNGVINVDAIINDIEYPDYEGEIANFIYIYSDDYYTDFKQAIEQDYIANQPYYFNDSNLEIIINVDCLNNFKYEYFGQYFFENISYFNTNLSGTYITYNGDTYFFDYAGIIVGDVYQFVYQYQSGYQIFFNGQYFKINADNIGVDFESPITWQLNNTTYQMIKNAMIQDLEYGEYVSIFGELTDSTTGFIGVLNSGIQEVVNVFYYDNALTTIGILSVLVIAISLGYFLFRLLIGLIRMRG